MTHSLPRRKGWMRHKMHNLLLVGRLSTLDHVDDTGNEAGPSAGLLGEGGAEHL